ncbi:MAG: hypothetical protein D3909_13760, partial [Candidatus Electrothrix sp. ATG1]|nr:hypothetical protein [Candidatus Electrothrix sp. ATG1]
MNTLRTQQQAFLGRLDAHSFAPPVVEKILTYGAPVGAVIEQHTRLGRCMDRLQQLVHKEEQQGRVLGAGT